MEKNPLINGKLVYPNKLIISRKFNIGLVGSGQMAEEYIKVLESYNHKLVVIVSSSNSISARRIAKKKKIKLYNSINLANIANKKIDAWIICPQWQKLKENLEAILEINKPALIEKSIAISSDELKKIIKKKNKKKISNIFIGYNRNYYDYLFYLIKEINDNKLLYINISIFDQFKKILKKFDGKIKDYLTYYSTSHWISLVLKILELSNLKLVKINKKVLNSESNSKKIKLELVLKRGNRKIILDLLHAPDLPKNHEMLFYFDNKIIQISPIEMLKISEKIHHKKNKKINIYKVLSNSIEVNKKFKPGLRFEYFDFINNIITGKKSVLKTDLNNLVKIYKICELLN